MLQQHCPQFASLGDTDSQAIQASFSHHFRGSKSSVSKQIIIVDGVSKVEDLKQIFPSKDVKYFSLFIGLIFDSQIAW